MRQGSYRFLLRFFCVKSSSTHAVVGVSAAAGLAALELVPARNQNLHCSTVLSKQGKLSKLMLHTTVRSYRLYVFHCALFPQSLVRIASQ